MCNRPTLRPASASDMAFMFRLYSTTRADELLQTGWSAAQRDAFLQQQFEARRRSYALQFPGAETMVIMNRGSAVGGMIVQRTDAEIRLVDIVILPGHRGMGHGRHVIEILQAEARERGRPVRLSVHNANRARYLYARLGFNITGIAADHVRMEWAPSPA